MEFPTSSSFFHFRFKKLIHFIVYSLKSIIETVLEKSIIENLLLQNLKYQWLPGISCHMNLKRKWGDLLFAVLEKQNLVILSSF